MALTQITTDQIDGYTPGGGTTERFSGSCGTGSTFSITAASTARSVLISLKKSGDSEYRASTCLTFGSLAGAQTVIGQLFYDGSASYMVQCARDSGGTGLTFSLLSYAGLPFGASLGAALGWTNYSYAITVIE